MEVFWGVRFRLVIAAWITLLLVLGLLYLMNDIKFDNLISTIVSSKLEVVSSTIESSVQRAERLGISLQSANNVKEQINKARLHDKNIQAISLIDSQGNIIYQSSKSGEIRNIPYAVEKQALQPNEEKWTYSNNSALYSGTPITDGFDSLSGSIVIEYDKSSLFGFYEKVQKHLFEVSCFIFISMALILFFVIYIGFRNVETVVKLMFKENYKDHNSL